MPAVTDEVLRRTYEKRIRRSISKVSGDGATKRVGAVLNKQLLRLFPRKKGLPSRSAVTLKSRRVD
ncbi:hypothetical protein O9993_07065 [Vibrio lentus]|nr:hypothetical protein [Vibrio lentus]